MSRKKIFIVDDDVVNLKTGKNAISGHYDAFAMDSAAAMFQMLRNVRPDLILLDIMMPVMDGHQALAKLKADPATADIPVIFLTAKGDMDSILDSVVGGVKDYVIKPFEANQLLERIQSQLG
jgi:putative two-component system response regulator